MNPVTPEAKAEIRKRVDALMKVQPEKLGADQVVDFVCENVAEARKQQYELDHHIVESQTQQITQYKRIEHDMRREIERLEAEVRKLSVNVPSLEYRPIWESDEFVFAIIDEEEEESGKRHKGLAIATREPHPESSEPFARDVLNAQQAKILVHVILNELATMGGDAPVSPHNRISRYDLETAQGETLEVIGDDLGIKRQGLEGGETSEFPEIDVSLRERIREKAEAEDVLDDDCELVAKIRVALDPYLIENRKRERIAVDIAKLFFAECR